MSIYNNEQDTAKQCEIVDLAGMFALLIGGHLPIVLLSDDKSGP